MTAKAIVSHVETLTIMVDMRPPKAGELGYCVQHHVTDPVEALHEVLSGRGSWNDGECGVGWYADRDQPEFEPDDEWVQFEIVNGKSTGRIIARGTELGGRNITVVVKWTSCEPGTARPL